ncbi:LexA family transcriptional repressor [Pandoraea sp. XJJ-1]|uniref:S24 family peptidase n=1 Tax=Pandoraea sp. XJJ-1 TaxID=3002643 RepID=UPI00227EEC28|nr:S24 family peptidase [Pandoraea sp. XJJ-1]WAL81504.1 LexA family transcriptional repressor [Pandoraea sp. XJJ-1]
MKSIEEIRRRNFASAVSEKCGNSQTTAADQLGYSTPSLVSRYISGAKPIGKGTARKIESTFGYPEFWMDVEHSGRTDEQPNVTLPLPADKGNVLVYEDPSDLPEDPDRVWIDRYDYGFSAGNGGIQWELRQKHALPFDAGFFKKIGSNPKNCKMVVVRGDSMEPYLFNRDSIIIDDTKTAIRDGRVYAIYFEGEPLVKQIFTLAGGGIVLHSINSGKYRDKEIPPNMLEFVVIVGEVIYRSGSGWGGGN